MIDFNKTGKKIAKFRKDLNLTQDDLAEKLFVSRQTVSKWENGERTPSIDVLLELTKLFDVTFENLLSLDEKISVDEENIFNGKNRLFIVQSIIKKDLVVKLADVFYQFSPIERMMVLKAIKKRELKCNIDELYPKLTTGEQAFLRKEDEK